MRAKPETRKMMHDAPEMRRMMNGERKARLASVKARKAKKTGMMQSAALRAVRSM